MVAYIALFISLICLILCIVILVKFKKLFSSNGVIQKSRNFMDRMVADMNNQAMRDIEIVNENTKQLKQILLEAENTMNTFNEASDRLRSMIFESEKYASTNLKSSSLLQGQINNFSSDNLKVRYQENKNVAPLKTVSQMNKETVANKYKKNSPVDPNATYSVTNNTQVKQKSLFDEEEIKITSDGAAYREVPVIHTKVLDEKPASMNYINVVKTKKSLAEKVNELFVQGFPVEEIAKQLTCSVTEVQTIIDLGI